MESQAGGVHPEPHKDLYFSDGDVILCASSVSAKKTFLLRVHKLLLSLHSPVFKDMFAFPTDPSVNETLDGIPVVRMPDDAEELATFITLFYKPLSLKRDMHGIVSRTVLRHLLSLASKYQADSIREEAVAILTRAWPRTLSEWFVFRASMNQRIQTINHLDRDPWDDLPEKYFPEPVEDLRLAIDFEIHAIVPVIYYRLAISDPLLKFGEDFTEPEQLSANWKCLRADDWERLIIGKERLYNSSHWLPVQIPLIFPESSCKSRDVCTSVTVQLRDDLHHTFDAHYTRRPDFIGEVYDLLDTPQRWSGYCAVCAPSFIRLLKKSLHETWNTLSFTFDCNGE